ncbi:MAG: hypothetical protein N2505_03925 [Endomicrobia bacterium]|nr:hypothetical protein [Endomicrobiia bacterium]MDW8056424.1 hypothetical protein [Elusimicrobiota bacterium]
MDKKCPGTDTRYLKIEIKKCPYCSYDIEFFSDEIKVICPNCKKEVLREEVPSCISWCKYAKECIGEEKWNEIKRYIEDKQQKMSIKEQLLAELRFYFLNNVNQILYTHKLIRYAENIIIEEPSANSNIVFASLILYKIVENEINNKYKQPSIDIKKQVCRDVVEKVLNKLGIKKQVIKEVYLIVSSYYTKEKLKNINFDIFCDTQNFIELEKKFSCADKEKLKQIIDETFITLSAKNLAKKIYL